MQQTLTREAPVYTETVFCNSQSVSGNEKTRYSQSKHDWWFYSFYWVVWKNMGWAIIKEAVGLMLSNCIPQSQKRSTWCDICSQWAGVGVTWDTQIMSSVTSFLQLSFLPSVPFRIENAGKYSWYLASDDYWKQQNCLTSSCSLTQLTVYAHWGMTFKLELAGCSCFTQFLTCYFLLFIVFFFWGFT